MRKIIRTLFIVLVLSAFITTNAFAAPTIIFNGATVKSEVPPVVEQGVTLVPLRTIMETYGANVGYEHTTKKVTVTKNNLTIVLKVGDKIALVNSTKVTLITAPKIISSRTMVPLRFISESLNAQVHWNNQTKTVTITYTEAGQPQAPNQPQLSADEKAILDLVNQTRKEHGLKELVWVDELAAVARSHSEDMAVNSFFDHNSPNTGSPSDRSKRAGLPGVGENIAAGPLTPATVHEAWMNSPGHRANILNPDYRYIGVGLYFSSNENDPYGGKYFTQNFIAGDTFLSAPAGKISIENAYIQISGYSTLSNPKVTVYKMIDDRTFSDSYEVPLNVVGGKFTQSIELKLGKGNYSIWASGFDNRTVTLK